MLFHKTSQHSLNSQGVLHERDDAHVIKVLHALVHRNIIVNECF